MKRLYRRWAVMLTCGVPVFALSYVEGLWDALPLWAFALFAMGVWTVASWIADFLGFTVTE